MVSGTAGGGLCMWTGRNCSTAVKDAHSGAVEVLSFGRIAGGGGGGVVASGGRDAKVKLWSSLDLSPVATLDVMATPSVAGLRQVRHVFLFAWRLGCVKRVPGEAGTGRGCCERIASSSGNYCY